MALAKENWSWIGWLLMGLLGPGLGGFFGIGGLFANLMALAADRPQSLPWWVYVLAICLSFFTCALINNQFFNGQYSKHLFEIDPY